VAIFAVISESGGQNGRPTRESSLNLASASAAAAVVEVLAAASTYLMSFGGWYNHRYNNCR
jgi:hypothetical protein